MDFHGDQDITVTYLLYAEDILFFSEAQELQLRYLRLILLVLKYYLD